MQAQGTPLYRVKAVAEMFDVSTSTIYRAIESGKLAALKVTGSKERGSLRISESAIRSYRQACAVAAVTAGQVDGGEGSDVVSGGVA